MAHRRFRDGLGREWDVWEVRPDEVESRLVREHRLARYSGPERRRRHRDVRLLVPESMRAGWLAFEREGLRCRLAPVPEGWEHLPDGELASLLSQARPVPSSSSSARRGRRANPRDG